MENKWRSGSFKYFVEVKEKGLDDLETFVQQSSDKVSVVRDFVMFSKGLDEHGKGGIVHILEDIVSDLNLVSAEIRNATKEGEGEQPKVSNN